MFTPLVSTMTACETLFLFICFLVVFHCLVFKFLYDVVHVLYIYKGHQSSPVFFYTVDIVLKWTVTALSHEYFVYIQSYYTYSVFPESAI